MFGYSLTFAKLFSATAAAVSGGAIWAIGRRHFGPVTAVLAAALFLFASQTLKASTNMTGVNLTTMWLALALWQLLRGRGFTAGALFGLAVTTGFYSVAAVCAALALSLFRWPQGATSRRARYRFALRLAAGVVVVAGSINLVFYLVASDAYVEGVYTYHSLKALRDPHMVPLFGGDIAFPLSLLHNIGELVDGREFTKELYYHSHLWLGLLAAPLVGAAAFFSDGARRAKWWRFFAPSRLHQDGPHGAAALLWLVAVALFVQYAMFRELYSFYWVLIYPTLSLSTAYALVYGARLVIDAPRPAALGGGLTALAGVVAIALLASHRPWSGSLQSVFHDELEETGRRNDYIWRSAPILSGLADPVVHALFWNDYRLKGNLEHGYRHYLWTKKRALSTLDEVAGYVRDHSAPDETIAGSSTLAPIVALAAGRRIAADEADTNNKRFKTGLLAEADYWNTICADQVRFIVATPRSYFTTSRMDNLPTATRWFSRVKSFEDDQLRYRGSFPIVLYERVGDPPDGSGAVCRWEPKPGGERGR